MAFSLSDIEAQRFFIERQNRLARPSIDNSVRINAQIARLRSARDTAMPRFPHGNPSYAGSQLSYNPAQQPKTFGIQEAHAQRAEHEKEVLQEWHAEWGKAERTQQRWKTNRTNYGTRRPSLLTRPANIDAHAHQRNANRVDLVYWGADIDAPAGYLRQKERKMMEARELALTSFMGKHK